MTTASAPLSWFGIVRLGLVQTALGAVVVLTTSTLNRVMVIELALPAMIPGLLVAMHYAMQVLRPWLGHGSDVGGRRFAWIVGGMAALAAGGLLAAVATALMASQLVLGLVVAVIAFIMIGIGVGAAGTSLLVLLAKRTAPQRRSAAASIAWIMMIAGFIVTTAVAGKALDPFSGERLMLVSGTVSAIAMMLTLIGVWGIEQPELSVERAAATAERGGFMEDFREICREPQARRFAIFIFVSMLAYSAQDLILEPFAGSVFSMTPGQTTQLSSVQHMGALIGMILMPAMASLHADWRTKPQPWIIGGCLASALALLSLVAAATVGPAWPLRGSVLLLGITNGVYAIAAIGAMMNMVSEGRDNREGTRMGLWGASQAISFGIGGFVGTAAADAARAFMPTTASAYAAVFAAEAALFVLSAWLAIWIKRPREQTSALQAQPANQGA
ncbi:light harvesting pigment Major Facilitator Family (MFS) transporter, Bch2-like [Bradyrhizobium sp. ORS 278]|uniref:BCD family MFS transporter n=1 Tax=Bradyrhizobium sp. (strain ORS 278) TaxID=114615 RepID=UPI0001507EF4|nr:BCD family MFS transporter [Bradyrhizobium sp. ORS 278]CAL75512.1 light harvesting pigment Major Facilitator Family (MFS) transporter, Bch2-like [Bradyrhizobium sp. ORS 278]